ncbi:MAG TPA: hypothetical protein VK201_12940 [bacterium]|jgi:hypothetical protein|nr:hypothetical protein [bacterium]
MCAVAVSFIFAPADPERPDGDDQKIHVIVPPAQAHLADPLTRMFEGRGDVEVLVDRRRGERRTQDQVVGSDRRRADRRRLQGDGAVVIGKASQSDEPPKAAP